MSTPLREILATFAVQADINPLVQADKQIEKTKSGMSGLSDTLKKIGTAFVAAFAVREVSDFIGDQIRLGSEVKDTADRLGVGTDELQQFQFAAKLSGVSSEEAAHSLGHLNRTIGEARSGSAEAAKAFAGVGLSLVDANGKTRPTLDVLTDLADTFQKTDDPAKKTALAMSVLGRSGTSLIPVLNQGGAAVRALFKEANDLGGVLGEDFVENADAAGDQIDKFSFAMRGVKAQLAIAVLPALTDLVKLATDGAKELKTLATNSTLLETGFVALGVVLGGVAIALGIVDLEMLAAAGVFVLAAIGVGLLYLAFDDLYGLWNGNDSVSGEILDFFIGIGARQKEVQALKDSVNELGEALGSLGGNATESKDLMEIMSIEGKKFIGSIIATAIVLARVIEGIADTISYVIKFMQGFNGAGREGKGFGDAVSAGQAKAGPFNTRAFDKLPDFKLNGYGAPDADLQKRGQEAKVSQQFNVTVNGTPKDPKQLGKDIVSGGMEAGNDADYRAALAYGGAL